MKPDFNAEETASVQKDKREIQKIVREMAEYLPQEDPEKGKYIMIYTMYKKIEIKEKKWFLFLRNDQVKCLLRKKLIDWF